MMKSVVDEGTGTPAQLGGIDVAGKTGTASIGIPGSNLTQPWFIGFAPVQDPKVAVAVTYREDAGRVRRHGRGADRQAGDPDAPRGRPVMPELATGTLIDGRYRVVSRVGAGGMADVFCAEDQQLGRKVAVKLLHRRFAEDPGFVERFRREAQAAAGLQHPNVVSVYDRGAFDGTYYIAMEYLPGRSLKQLIRRGGAARPGPRDRHHRADPQGGAVRASARRHPPRPEAAQRDHRRDRPRQGHRLRDRSRRRLRHDRDRLDHGHGPVPVARAGPGPRGQRARRTCTPSA